MVVCKFKVLDIYRLGSIKYFSCTFKTSNHSTFKSVYTKCMLNFLTCTKRKSLPKNNLLLQKLFNHSPSTISTKFAFHFWRKCLFACLKIVFFFARWGCNSNHHCSQWLCQFFFFPFRIFVQDESHSSYWQRQFCWFVLVVFQWCTGLLHFKRGLGLFRGFVYPMSKEQINEQH